MVQGDRGVTGEYRHFPGLVFHQQERNWIYLQPSLYEMQGLQRKTEGDARIFFGLAKQISDLLIIFFFVFSMFFFIVCSKSGRPLKKLSERKGFSRLSHVAKGSSPDCSGNPVLFLRFGLLKGKCTRMNA